MFTSTSTPLLKRLSSLPNDGGDGPKSFTERMKAFFQQYGKLGLFVYFSLSTFSLTSIYLTIRSGVDVQSLIQKIGLPQSKIIDSAGTFAVAYAIHKMLLPLRFFLTIGMTSFIAKRSNFLMPKKR